MKTTKHATTNYKMLAPYLKTVDENEGYAKFESNGYMDLTIEKLWYDDPFGNPVYSIAHWGELNGDAMRDPEMTFGVNKDRGEIVPLSFENSYMAYYEEVFTKPEQEWLYSEKSLRGLDDFLHTWLNNIKEQGFVPDKVREELWG